MEQHYPADPSAGCHSRAHNPINAPVACLPGRAGLVSDRSVSLCGHSGVTVVIFRLINLSSSFVTATFENWCPNLVFSLNLTAIVGNVKRFHCMMQLLWGLNVTVAHGHQMLTKFTLCIALYFYPCTYVNKSNELMVGKTSDRLNRQEELRLQNKSSLTRTWLARPAPSSCLGPFSLEITTCPDPDNFHLSFSVVLMGWWWENFLCKPISVDTEIEWLHGWGESQFKRHLSLWMGR